MAGERKCPDSIHAPPVGRIPDAAVRPLGDLTRFLAFGDGGEGLVDRFTTILESCPEQAVTLAALQGFVDELAIQQFGWIIGQETGDIGWQPFTQQGASRSRLVEQAFEKLIVWLGWLGHLRSGPGCQAIGRHRPRCPAMRPSPIQQHRQEVE